MSRGGLAALLITLAGTPAQAAFTCEADGTATRCDDAGCFSLGPCPLGCDAPTERCAVASTVPADAFISGASLLDLTLASSPVTLDSDTGAITDGLGATLRPAGAGLGGTLGVSFRLVNQPDGGPAVGVFSVSDLLIPAGLTVRGVGAAPLVVLASGSIVVEGTLDVGAQGLVPGPGGYAGGGPGATGLGPCGGPASPLGTDTCPDLCVAGAGGAGHGGSGGAGGPVSLATYSVSYPATAGAGVCGATQLSPLLGGSGGAGGGLPGTFNSVTPGLAPVPGKGGAGGGAVQLSAGVSITVGATGAITAPGEGGGPAVSAGGAAGGAGGAILLEAPLVTLLVGGALAANGGGGGGGDCT